MNNKNYMRAFETVLRSDKIKTDMDKIGFVNDLEQMGFHKESDIVRKLIDKGKSIDEEALKSSLNASYKTKIITEAKDNMYVEDNKVKTVLQDDVSDQTLTFVLANDKEKISRTKLLYEEEIGHSLKLLADKMQYLCEQSSRMFCMHFMGREKFGLVLEGERDIYERTNEERRKERFGEKERVNGKTLKITRQRSQIKAEEEDLQISL